MGSVSVAGRIAAVVAVAVAVVVVAVLLFAGGGGGLHRQGAVHQRRPAREGQPGAGRRHRPARSPRSTSPRTARPWSRWRSTRSTRRSRGTQATIRQASLSGIANRYVDLTIRRPAASATIDDGGTIGRRDTTTAVDLDQLFNVFDPPTRADRQELFQGLGGPVRRQGEQANGGLRVPEPGAVHVQPPVQRAEPRHPRARALPGRLVDARQRARRAPRRPGGADRQPATTTPRARRREHALADSIARLPDFMRQANTTFVDLRFALDDVDPLVEASKPVARKLQPFLPELRPFARDARPTVADLSAVLRRGGDDNDLIDLTRTIEPLARARSTPASATASAGRGASRRSPRPAATRGRSSSSGGPTRPTCSAGSTTSRRRAPTTRSAGFCASRSFSTRSARRAATRSSQSRCPTARRTSSS